MKISIITIAYNNENDIRPTIESVINQTYQNIEYIVIDGDSSDKTLDVINEYKSSISIIISEPDKNLYDAINKGIKVSTGNIVGLVHAGDQLFNNQVVGLIAEHFMHNKIDISYGHSKVIGRKNWPVRINKSPPFKRTLVRHGWMPSHQSIYVRRELFEKLGYYRVDCDYVADYEWFIRFFYLNRPIIKRLDEFIVKFYTGGISTSNYLSKLKKPHRTMINKCWELNGLEPPKRVFYMKWLRKPKQFFLAWIDNMVSFITRN